MRQIMILSILTIISANVLSKDICGGYTLRLNKSTDCYISIIKDGKYQIELIKTSTDDISYSIEVSSGYYHVFKKILFFHDNYNKFDLMFKIEGTKVISKNGFEWFKNKSFILSTTDIEWNNMISNYSPNELKNSIKRNNSNNFQWHSLYFGRYSYNSFGVNFYIKLIKPNQYLYVLDDLILSKGTFRRNKNELILHDSSFNYDFSFLIHDKMIEDKFFPSNKNFYFRMGNYSKMVNVSEYW